MKLQFDPNQQYQLEAVAAVADLFDGQPLEKPEFSVIYQTDDEGLFSRQTRTELGMGNRLLLAEEKLLANARGVQTRHDLEIANPAASLEAWELFDAAMNAPRRCPHFSVEMETGTGKTYVYLRTIFELSRRYGFQKFISVVPSVAIREGVLKNIEITREHFCALYNNLPLEYFVYDAKKVNKLHQFVVSNTLQILVINIDAFRKNFSGTEEEQKSNVIYKESDRLSGRQPIEFVRFNNGRTLRLGEEIGGMREDIWRAQIKHTVKKHLDKELLIQARGIKVLSLSFKFARSTKRAAR